MSRDRWQNAEAGMTMNTNPKSKESAGKRTYNPMGGEDKHSEVERPDTTGREVGQSGGRGVPPLQKR